MHSYKYILASNSPRRKELLENLDLEIEVKVLKSVDESYPADLPKTEIPLYVAKKKAEAHKILISDDETILITADTIVLLEGKAYGKPKSEDDAKQMLRELSGHTHQVITGVCIISGKKEKYFSVTSDVTFSVLTEEEIEYYVTKYKPLDKAGAYGIQEWIGHVAVQNISGSYFNIVGLPVQRLYSELKSFYL